MVIQQFVDRSVSIDGPVVKTVHTALGRRTHGREEYAGYCIVTKAVGPTVQMATNQSICAHDLFLLQ